MTMATEKKLTDDESRRVAVTVREELARRHITRQQLALDAKISLSTLEKALSGKRPFTIATTVRLEEALKLELRDTQGNSRQPENLPSLAPESLGSYARPAVTWIEDNYVTLRPSFGEPDAVYAYLTRIEWDDAQSCLAFHESERMDRDFTQWGTVSIPHQSGHIYLVTNRHGQYRLIVVARPTINREMHGILTTLQAGRGSQLLPVSTPIVFVPQSVMTNPQFGRVTSADDCYDEYRVYLKRTIEDSYARLLQG